MKRLIDTNVLVYALIDNHPASSVCETFIREQQDRHTFYTTTITPFEIFHILWKTYGLEVLQVLEKVVAAVNSPLSFIQISERIMRIAFKKRIEYKLDTNDALLLAVALVQDIPSIVSDDRNLLKACEQEGLIGVSPLDESVREKIVQWEKENLPEKGISRSEGL
jgi:predicted nucleic acid-binding protein